ncbi:recombination regulator RecX [Bacillus luteus]|uniref:Regulatory protein RecX n=1 Tax=Alkalicoccus luteus TaxID=1237094 RepID=A0A969TUY0_9BACI|nr:recombination regulator RecX [Alkalicoccus luteus]NJP37810.1 recombination regulator RecX [Alkalicoccus luteus]
MPKIAKITAAKKTKQRYHIHLEKNGKEEYAFSVSEDMIVSEDLMKGKELTEEEITRLKSRDDVEKVYQRALNYLSYRMRSEKELKDYILGHEHVEEEDAADMIERLRKLDFVNDGRFAEAFVRTKKDQSRKGPRTIRQELKQKGISGKEMEDAMEQYSEEEAVELAVELVEKKQKSYKRESRRRKEQKLMQFLLQKGYSMDIASKALEQADIESDEEEELAAVRAQGEKLWRKHQSKSERERKQRVKQGLYQKGFPAEHIDIFLEEMESSDSL